MFLTAAGSKSPGSRLVAALVIILLASPAVAAAVPSSSSSAATQSLPSLHGFRMVGAAPQGLPILVTLAIPLRNVAALDTLVMQVSNPASPDYRHFLTPQQARSEFLPTAQFDSLVSYLQTSGFQIQMTALDSVVVVEGTAGQFRTAFGGGINTYTNGTSSYYASTGVTTFNGAYVYASNGTYLFAKPAVSTAGANGNVTFTAGSITAEDLQPVYNATYFYDHGFSGSGQTIGLLDFYGSPTVVGDLKLFDSTFGFPDAKFTITPVGPYDPGLGASVGWSTEVSLDVEASHAMAPGAAIDMYVANGALPLAVPLAKIVQDDGVTTLSQSFGYYEWYYSQSYNLGGPGFLGVYGLLPDEYYALGSAEGITFLSSSGDGGGSGYSSGPEGNLDYPSTSPFVTSVGGTQTYISESSSGGRSYVQTAWSNIGFVPNLVNEGGGGGGVSILEPKPWYQSKQSSPPSFPDGRLNPDLSLQAGIDPATEIVDSGQTVGVGGTSESSPLLAGLLTLVTQSLNGRLGLINPFLYGVGNTPAEYAKAFTPITFGYIIPWRASYGFNLATGWGSPNMGELATLLNSTASTASLDILGTIYNATGKGQLGYTPGQNLTISARITEVNTPITTGTFTMELETLKGAYSPTPMSYDSKSGNWTGTITMGQEAGFTYVSLNGTSSAGVPGQALGTIFAGYLGTLTATDWPYYYLPVDPWSWNSSSTLGLTVYTSDVLGDPAPAGPVHLEVEPYSIPKNSYGNSSVVSLNGTGTGAVNGSLSTPAPAGPVSLVMLGDTYGYAPMVYGIYLQSGYIYPNVAAEPGSVAPGQDITVIANPIAPVNVYFETSFETGRQFAYDVYVGSNVNATLLDPSGIVISSANLVYQPCAQALKVCNGGADAIYGQLPVPAGSAPGLYTIMLHATYRSLTPGGNITGSFYGQVWVSGPMLKPSISVVPGPGYVGGTHPPCDACSLFAGKSSFYEGEQAHVEAKLAYSNGTSVRQGEFTAVVYPDSLSGQYTYLMHTQYEGGKLVQLAYDPGSDTWVGNLTLPGPTNQGSLSGLGINSFDYSGPYDVFVTGITPEGVTTDSALSAQHPFYVQPYLYQSGEVSDLASNSQNAFFGATISMSGVLTGDQFFGVSTIQGSNITVASSQVLGSIELVNSNATFVGVTGGVITVNGSRLVLKDSSVDSLVIVSGKVNLHDSSYVEISPSLPVIQFNGPSKPVGSIASYNITVNGQSLTPTSLEAWVDGVPANLNVTSANGGLIALGQVNATSLDDGVHTLTINATQSDGMSSTYSASFSTNAHQLALEKQTSTLFNYAYVLAGVGGAALVIGIVALFRRRAAPPMGQPPPQV